MTITNLCRSMNARNCGCARLSAGIAYTAVKEQLELAWTLATDKAIGRIMISVRDHFFYRVLTHYNMLPSRLEVAHRT
jgi:hypothetical protein